MEAKDYSNIDAFCRCAGEMVKKERLARRFSQDELSEKADVTQETISNIENGHRSGRLETFFKLLDALEIKHSDFFVKVEKALQ